MSSFSHIAIKNLIVNVSAEIITYIYIFFVRILYYIVLFCFCGCRIEQKLNIYLITVGYLHKFSALHSLSFAIFFLLSVNQTQPDL